MAVCEVVICDGCLLKKIGCSLCLGVYTKIGVSKFWKIVSIIRKNTNIAKTVSIFRVFVKFGYSYVKYGSNDFDTSC